MSAVMKYRLISLRNYLETITNKSHSKSRLPGFYEKMKLTSIILLGCTSVYAASLSSLFERDINVCGWHLNGDDCICMNSQNGALLQAQTNTCCNNMGLTTKNAVSKTSLLGPP